MERLIIFFPTKYNGMSRYYTVVFFCIYTFFQCTIFFPSYLNVFSNAYLRSYNFFYQDSDLYIPELSPPVRYLLKQCNSVHCLNQVFKRVAKELNAAQEVHK